jgi:hypothetical protein
MAKTKSSKEGFGYAIFSFIVLTAIVIFIFPEVVRYKSLIGLATLFFGFVPWIPVYIAGRRLKTISADIIYGIVDGGILAIFVVAGASFAGLLGAVLGSAVGNAISDRFGGLWEGVVASWLRNHGINEARTPLSASMGKMSGVAIGSGIVLTIAWTLLGL